MGENLKITFWKVFGVVLIILFCLIVIKSTLGEAKTVDYNNQINKSSQKWIEYSQFVDDHQIDGSGDAWVFPNDPGNHGQFKWRSKEYKIYGFNKFAIDYLKWVYFHEEFHFLNLYKSGVDNYWVINETVFMDIEDAANRYGHIKLGQIKESEETCK